MNKKNHKAFSEIFENNHSGDLKKNKDVLDKDSISYLTDLINNSSLEQLEYKCANFSIKLSKNINSERSLIQQKSMVKLSQQKILEEQHDLIEDYITAPMVGRIYLKPRPDEDAFIKIGDEIKIGQIICIIEAMKVMNQIKSTKSGIVKKIIVKNEEPVEFGQKLILIE